MLFARTVAGALAGGGGGELYEATTEAVVRSVRALSAEIGLPF